MKKRIKLVQEHACLLRCYYCGKLIVGTVGKRPRGLGCVWSDIVDADLRPPLDTIGRLAKVPGAPTCAECAAKGGIKYSRFTQEQLKQFVSLLGILLGIEDGNVPPSGATPSDEPPPELNPNIYYDKVRRECERYQAAHNAPEVDVPIEPFDPEVACDPTLRQ